MSVCGEVKKLTRKVEPLLVPHVLRERPPQANIRCSKCLQNFRLLRNRSSRIHIHFGLNDRLETTTDGVLLVSFNTILTIPLRLRLPSRSMSMMNDQRRILTPRAKLEPHSWYPRMDSCSMKRWPSNCEVTTL